MELKKIKKLKKSLSHQNSTQAHKHRYTLCTCLALRHETAKMPTKQHFRRPISRLEAKHWSQKHPCAETCHHKTTNGRTTVDLIPGRKQQITC